MNGKGGKYGLAPMGQKKISYFFSDTLYNKVYSFMISIIKENKIIMEQKAVSCSSLNLVADKL